MKKLLFMAGLLSASAITADAVAQSYNPYYPSNVPNNYSAPKRSASSRKDDFKKFSIGLDYVITDVTMADHSFSIDSPLLGGTPYSGTLDNFEDSLDTLSGSIGWRPLRYLGFEVFYQQSLSDNQIKYQESYAQDTRFAQAEYEFEYKAYGADAILEASSHNPDIVLLDLGLPDIDGVDVIKKIRTWSNMPIIVISARSEDTDKIDALDAGADDYLTKPFSVEELLARLRVTQRRLNMIQNETAAEVSVFTNGQLRIDYAAGCAYLGDEELHLTPIEYKLLCLLSRNIGKVLTHTFITQSIWGSCWDNDIASLRVFMATLRKKLEKDADSPQYIQTHIGVGYRMMKVE